MPTDDDSVCPFPGLFQLAFILLSSALVVAGVLRSLAGSPAAAAPLAQPPRVEALASSMLIGGSEMGVLHTEVTLSHTGTTTIPISVTLLISEQQQLIAQTFSVAAAHCMQETGRYSCVIPIAPGTTVTGTMEMQMPMPDEALLCMPYHIKSGFIDYQLAWGELWMPACPTSATIWPVYLPLVTAGGGT